MLIDKRKRFHRGSKSAIGGSPQVRTAWARRRQPRIPTKEVINHEVSCYGTNRRCAHPSEKAPDLFKAAKEWMNEGLKNGRHGCHYIFPHGTGGFTITNANSHEELMDMICDYPLYPYLHWEVKALCDSDHSYDKFIELWQKLGT